MMNIKERNEMIKEFAQDVLKAVRDLEEFGFHEEDIASILEEVIKRNLKKLD